MNQPMHINEQHAANAFTQQSKTFDNLYQDNTIIQYKRQRVWQHIQPLLKPNSYILELNSGTGEDAIWLAKQGHFVHATDLSSGMLEVLKQKVVLAGQQERVTSQMVSFTQLGMLAPCKPYDMVFSNFAGLNCTGDLDKVLQSLSGLVKSGGYVTLVLLPRFCLWEFLLLFKGKFKTACRRLISRNGATAHIDGHYFKCWYYNPSFIIKQLKKDFDLRYLEGLCTIVPPSYIDHFAEKHPVVYQFLKNKEGILKNKWPWKYIGDYYIISFKKR